MSLTELQLSVLTNGTSDGETCDTVRQERPPASFSHSKLGCEMPNAACAAPSFYKPVQHLLLTWLIFSTIPPVLPHCMPIHHHKTNLASRLDNQYPSPLPNYSSNFWLHQNQLHNCLAKDFTSSLSTFGDTLPEQVFSILSDPSIALSSASKFDHTPEISYVEVDFCSLNIQSLIWHSCNFSIGEEPIIYEVLLFGERQVCLRCAISLLDIENHGVIFGSLDQLVVSLSQDLTCYTHSLACYLTCDHSRLLLCPLFLLYFTDDRQQVQVQAIYFDFDAVAAASK
jgi:hypothetical protein